jgi:lipopolysaccharide/colanic/teichoic acid biosynthesis glycosyltransferase
VELALIRFLKRAIDIVVAGIGLTLALPVLCVLGVAVRLEDGGPIFYRQRRALGVARRKGNGPLEVVAFDMWKLRTMRPDAERLSGPVLAKAGDPRVTRIGSFLRKTRLDELPQLFHVLRGDMSIVGPRPERPELVLRLAESIPLFEARAQGIKPGITGLAQVTLRYAGEPPPGSAAREVFGPCESEEDAVRVKLAFDMAYAASLTSLPRFLRTELGVLVATPLVMLRGLGR